MAAYRAALLALRSVLAMATAIAVVPVVSVMGGEFADLAGFPAGGAPRLAWDLGCVFIAGMSATWVLVKLAPRAPLRHAVVLLTLMLGVGLYAVIQLGDEFPPWFTTGLVLGIPLQVFLGVRCALRDASGRRPVRGD